MYGPGVMNLARHELVGIPGRNRLGLNHYRSQRLLFEPPCMNSKHYELQNQSA